MRLLVLDWEFINKKELYAAFDRMGIFYDLFTVPFDAYIKLDLNRAVEILLNQVESGRYDAGFSINFFSSFAETCYRLGIPYLSWSYDTPSFIGESLYRKYDTNYCFLFDSAEYEYHKAVGDCGHLYHLNLAVNPYDLKSLELQKNQSRLKADVSFVGKLYKINFENVYALLSNEDSELLKHLIDFQLNHRELNAMEGLVDAVTAERLINENVWKIFQEANVNAFSFEQYSALERMRAFLEYAVTYTERVQLLHAVSECTELAFFTGDSENEFLKRTDFRGPVDYDVEMPKVFYNSKININITSRNIKGGIPKRCLDIMAAGGFLLTNDQKDLYTEMENGRDLIVYHSTDEACELIEYYLKHDEERKAIAHNGYMKIKECFSYERQLSRMFSALN